MKLKSGAKIFTNLDKTNRIWVNSGLEVTNNLNGVITSRICYIPKSDWRLADESETNILLGTHKDEVKHYNSIGIIKIPDNFIKDIETLKISDVTTWNDLNHINETNAYQKFISGIIDFISEHLSMPGYSNELIVHNPCLIKKDLTTVTYSDKDNHYIGMHLDTWDNNNFYERPTSTNRLCVNLGKESRYFLYINQEIKEVLAMANVTDKDKNRAENDAYFLLSKFYEKNYSYPIVKIKLNPLEAYIAPTENIIHDGTSEANKYFGVTQTFRGFINPFLTD